MTENRAPSAGRPAPVRVAVVGAAGRMGTAVCGAVQAADDLELVATIGLDDDLGAALRTSGAEVAVDFTVPAAAQQNLRTIIDAGVHAVVGTTGWNAAAISAAEAQLAGARAGLGVIIAPNFALSAVFAGVLAAKAAPYFESVEIVELHHPDKVDAPSGTAAHAAAGIAAARAAAGTAPSPDATQGDEAARGAVIDGIHVHAVRLRGLTAHEEILLGNPGETLTIRQDSFDRSSFMPGVLLAVRKVAQRPGLTIGLENYLDLG